MLRRFPVDLSVPALLRKTPVALSGPALPRAASSRSLSSHCIALQHAVQLCRILPPPYTLAHTPSQVRVLGSLTHTVCVSAHTDDTGSEATSMRRVSKTTGWNWPSSTSPLRTAGAPLSSSPSMSARVPWAK